MTNEVINNVVEPEVVAENFVEATEEIMNATDPKKLLNANFGKGIIAGALIMCGVEVLGPKVVKGGKKVFGTFKKFLDKNKNKEADTIDGEAVEILNDCEPQEETK